MQKSWYRFSDPNWKNTVGIGLGALGASLFVAILPWLKANWWQIWPWMLILGIPLGVVWLVVRIIRHAWKG